MKNTEQAKQWGTFTGVGLGPGDPELITWKGLKALQQADLIFYPASSSDGKKSFALEILKQLPVETTCRPLYFPMKNNAEDFYREAFEEICKELETGKKVVLVSEGDILFYSTFGYVYRMAVREQIPCSLIPGIPAFTAASALGNSPLTERAEKLVVVPRPTDWQSVSHPLQGNNTVVLMKLSVFPDLYGFLKACKRPFLYAEAVGTERQFVCSDFEQLNGRKIPYFSLAIIYPEREPDALVANGKGDENE